MIDIEETSAFLEDVLGCERFYDMGPLEDPHGSSFGAYVNVDVRIKVSKARLFRSSYLNFEIAEPSYPGQQRLWPQVFDIGGWRLTFAVDDIDAALEHLRNLDVHVLGGKRREPTSGWSKDRDRISCLAPFGLNFDLISRPSESPESTPDKTSAWEPAYPDR